MNSTLKYIKKVPYWKTGIGILAISLSIYGILTTGYAYLIFLGLGFLFLHSEGVEISFESHKYREVFSILGLQIGKWKTLPKIEYVTIFLTTETTRVWGVSASTKVRNEVIIINLFTSQNRKIEIYRTYEFEDAFEMANQCAHFLDIDLLDSTDPHNSRWIDKKATKSAKEIVYED
jgi:hypothetical protein